MINEEIIKQFNISGEIVDFKQKTNGNINKTYVATYEKDGTKNKYLIQQINNYVFNNPYHLMENIEGVTNYLTEELYKEKDNIHKVLKVIKTSDGSNLLVCKNDDGKDEFYRAYNFIEDSVSYDTSENTTIVRNTGKAFGNFQKLLNNYPMNNLTETIKDFHNTKKRFINFQNNVEKDIVKRVDSVNKEVQFILNKKELYDIIVDKLESKEIPLRVTHNDTKVNNVMMNKKTGDYLAVVDLDTVMPGSGLYDYGDGVRSAASNAREDETDLTKVFIREDMFEAYTDGFLSEMSKLITEEEVKLMGKSIELMTLELGIRFLDDYICGDKYFKCDYDNHNLDRARNQLKLAKDIEEKMDYINNYIWQSYIKYKN